MPVRKDKCPWPWFGGKSDAAPAVWQALGDVPHYVEPFAGSLAVLLRRPHLANRSYYSETVNDMDGLLCLAPETRVLTGDLRWVAIGDVQPGDALIGFDEENPGEKSFGGPNRHRRWRHSVALRTRRLIRPCWRLVFDDGTEVIASEDHRWLGGSHRNGANGGRAWRWVQTRYMKCAPNDGQRSWVLRLCDVQNREDSHDAGWIAGFLDGEGNIRSNPGFGRVTASQKLGPVADRFYDLLRLRGFDVTASTIEKSNPKHQDITNFVVNGGMRETLRLLMMTRPERLVADCLRSIEQSSLYGRKHCAVGLVAKERVGPQVVVALETTTRTYVAEGLASHNCNAWRSIQHAPEAVADAASWPVSEADLHARHQALLRWREERQLEHLMGDPHWHDPIMAGWWMWGQSCWIGAGWCSGRGPWVADESGRLVKRGRAAGGTSKKVLPHLGNNGQGVNRPQLREPGVARQRPHLGNDGQGVTRPQLREPGVARQLPHLGNNGQGVNRPQLREPGVARQRPHLSDNGRGVNRPQLREPGVARQLPHLGDNGKGVNHAGTREPGVAIEYEYHPMTMPELVRWMQFLSARLRHVRILNGDWTRAVTSGASKTLPVRQGSGPAGIFLDPPYAGDVRHSEIYTEESHTVAADVRAWCLKNGDDPSLRIVLAGFDTEHGELVDAGWREVEWYRAGFLRGGMGNTASGGKSTTQQKRERLWLSPHCLDETTATQGKLF